MLCAPNIALKFTPETDGTKYKNQGIWVLENKKPTRHDIQTGASDDNFTEIRSNEIAENANLITGIKGKNSHNQGARNMRRGPRMF